VTAKALYDFEMKEEEKEDCLKFKKVDIIILCSGTSIITSFGWAFIIVSFQLDDPKYCYQIYVQMMFKYI